MYICMDTIFNIIIIIGIVLVLIRSNMLKDVLHIFNCERIGGHRFRKGTKKSIYKARVTIVTSSRRKMLNAIEEFYAKESAGVDSYLRWFYSFRGSNAQLIAQVKCALGFGDNTSFADYLNNKFKDTVSPDSDLKIKLDNIESEMNEAFIATAREILEHNLISIGKKDVALKIESALDYYKKVCIPETSVDPICVAGVSMISGGIGSVIVSAALPEIIPDVVADIVSGICIGIPVTLIARGILIAVDRKRNKKQYKEAILENLRAEKAAYIDAVNKSFDEFEADLEKISDFSA